MHTRILQCPPADLKFVGPQVDGHFGALYYVVEMNLTTVKTFFSSSYKNIRVRS
jgi:hypothetical protein